MWVSRGSHTREIHLRKPGLFGIIAGALLVGLVIAVIIGIVLSIFLIWIPIVGLILAGLLLASIARGWRRPG